MIELRPAQASDATLLFALRNDPDAVRFSMTGREVEWEEHQRWLAAALADPDCRLFIALADAMPVGQGRIDLDREYGTADLSVAVDPAHRRRGYATAIIRELVQRAREFGIDAIGATVHGKNAGSLRAFLKAGFLIDHDFLPVYWAGEER